MLNVSSAVVDALVAEIYRLDGAVVAAGDAVTAAFGLSAARWQVLGTISVGGEATVPDLARRIGTTRQSVQRIVSEMARAGWLDLADNPRHRRARLVRMTASGRAAYDAVIAVWAPHASDLERSFGPEALRDLAGRMAALRLAFRDLAARCDPSPVGDEET